MFVKTTPKEFLFDGLPFCIKPVIGIAAIICKQIADAKSNTVSQADDGSLKFALFNYVSYVDLFVDFPLQMFFFLLFNAEK